MAFTVNPLTHVISIPKADLTLVSGTLYTMDTEVFRLALRAWEDDPEGMVQPKTHKHNTTVTIVGTTYYRAINIIPPYSITFEDGQYSVMLQGSNNNIWDIGSGILNQNQVQVIPTNTAGGQIISVGSGLSTDQNTKLMALPETNDISDVKSLVESQRGAHTWAGNMYYVDPINGATYASGASGRKDDPILSLQDCHDNLVTDSNHDVIILLPGSASGPTVMDERVTLSKRYLFVRGPGRDFIFTPTTEGDTIKIRADGIELSGFQVGTHTTGNGNGIDATDCDFTKIHHVWVNWTRNDGVKLKNVQHAIIENNTLHEAGQGTDSNAIQISADVSCDHIEIKNNHITDIAGHGIRVGGGALTKHTFVTGNSIEDCTGDGINIQSDVLDTFVAGNTFGNITGEDIDNNGINSIIQNNEQWATVAGVHNAQMEDHRLDGSFGANQAYLSFDGKVRYVSTGTAGTAYPIGTGGNESSNLNDCVTIGQREGIDVIQLEGFAITTTVLDISDFILQGSSMSTIWMIAGALLVTAGNSQFYDMQIQGNIAGINCKFERCVIVNNHTFTGTARDCLINPALTLALTSSRFIRCYASATTTISIGAFELNMLDCSGAFEFTDKTSTGTSIIGMAHGTVTVASSCLAGTIQIEGNCEIIDNSAVGCTVIDKTNQELTWKYTRS